MSAELPSAFDALAMLSGSRARPAIFLDYDGTLTPIVERPEWAILDPSVRGIVRRLAGVAEVAVVTGRDLEDARGLLDLPGVTIAGSHGFELMGADGQQRVLGGGEAFLPALDAAAADLTSLVEAIPGARLERKRFALAVHFRTVEASRHTEVISAVAEVSRQHPSLRLGHGKMVVELRPDTHWDKGTLVTALLEEWRPQEIGAIVYLGDDVTDEDAFVALGESEADAVTVMVGERAQGPTAARYALPDVDAVARWLERLASALDG